MSEKELSSTTRIERSATIEVNAPPDEAFPLFTPLGEGLWSEDWDPVFRHPEEAELEDRAVFTTPDGPGGDRVWTILKYRPGKHRISYLCITPGLLHSWIDISCEGTGMGTSKVEVAYTDTALSEKGQAYIERDSEEAFTSRIGHWEHAINRYLRSGGSRT
ncbi:MAG: SRPBCC family protein [bacterium]